MMFLFSLMFTVHLTDCLTIQYIDTDNNRYFDSLVVNDCGNIVKHKLNESIMQGRPDNVEGAVLKVRLVNYNYIKNDAYFQVVMTIDSVKQGYWEHVMGSEALIWRQ